MVNSLAAEAGWMELRNPLTKCPITISFYSMVNINHKSLCLDKVKLNTLKLTETEDYETKKHTIKTFL